MRGGRSWSCCPCHSKKIAAPPEQIPLCRIVDIGTRSRPGKVPIGGTSRDASSNGPNTLDRTMQLPLTLAGGLRTTFADVVSSPLPGRLAALVRRLHEPIHVEGREKTVRRRSRWQPTTHTAQRHGSAYHSRSA